MSSFLSFSSRSLRHKWPERQKHPGPLPHRLRVRFVGCLLRVLVTLVLLEPQCPGLWVTEAPH